MYLNIVARDISNVKHKTIFLMKREKKRDISNKTKLRKYITLKENVLYQILFPPKHYLNRIEVFLLNLVVKFYL